MIVGKIWNLACCHYPLWLVSAGRGHGQDTVSLNNLGTMVRDNIFIHFLKLEIFLKHPGGYYKSSRRFCRCVYEAMAVILTICLDQLVPRWVWQSVGCRFLKEEVLCLQQPLCWAALWFRDLAWVAHSENWSQWGWRSPQMLLLCFSWSSVISFSYPMQELGEKIVLGSLPFAGLLSNFYCKWVRKWKRESSGLCSGGVPFTHTDNFFVSIPSKKANLWL